MFNPVIVLLAVAIGLLVIGHNILSPVICWVGFMELMLAIMLFVNILWENYLIIPKDDHNDPTAVNTLAHQTY